MPYGDRTGPNGFGPRTGRGLGYCTGNDTPGYLVGGRRGYGRGYGRGRGRGFGRGFNWGYSRRYVYDVPPYPSAYPAPQSTNPDKMIEELENEKKALELEIERWKDAARKETQEK